MKFGKPDAVRFGSVELDPFALITRRIQKASFTPGSCSPDDPQHHIPAQDAKTRGGGVWFFGVGEHPPPPLPAFSQLFANECVFV